MLLLYPSSWQIVEFPIAQQTPSADDDGILVLDGKGTEKTLHIRPTVPILCPKDLADLVPIFGEALCSFELRITEQADIESNDDAQCAGNQHPQTGSVRVSHIFRYHLTTIDLAIDYKVL